MGIRKRDLTDIYGVRRWDRITYRLPDAPETGFRHSDYYHKYFRGYTEIRRKNAKGRVKVERYYTQPWIVSGLSGKAYWLCRLLYACLVAASGILYVWAMCQDIPATRSVAVVLPGFPGMLLLILLAAVIFFYITAPKRMTLWDHASTSKRLRWMAVATAGVQALTALTLAGYTLVTGAQVGKSLICAGVILLSAGLSGSLFLLERNMPYSESPNDTKLPEGEAHEIW